ncbi:FitA-like ribbon-helix-helix domain-containing protein [Sphingomonas bacterium]|uniref:FitA-like ribbon-helix-helix domain-containing protein n=1 Tax=Sphingomonas bacterium TaxID=1895847 RepID=UPI00157564C1|nr:hypothetical protein [Sphingomonas bacterium]
MGQVLIRNLDDETLAAYREAAQHHERSLEAELRHVLKTFRPLTAVARADAIDRLAAIRAMTPDVEQTPAEVIIRELRDA